MAKYVSLSGRVSHLNSDTHVSGYDGKVRSSKKTSFRVDGRPAVSFVDISLADGDEVTIAGREKNGELVAFAMHNHTTSVTVGKPHTWMLIFGLFFLAIGLPTVIVLIGFALIFVGGYLLLLYFLAKNSYALLQSELANQS